jgi:hypothetical protein
MAKTVKNDYHVCLLLDAAIFLFQTLNWTKSVPLDSKCYKLSNDPNFTQFQYREGLQTVITNQMIGINKTKENCRISVQDATTGDTYHNFGQKGAAGWSNKLREQFLER